MKYYLKEIYYHLISLIKLLIIALYFLIVGFFVLLYLLFDYIVGKLNEFRRWF